MMLYWSLCVFILSFFFFFFFNDTATTEIYTLSLHDALPISWLAWHRHLGGGGGGGQGSGDRKSTRLNSSHLVISYAVFCLKKKKNKTNKLFLKKKKKRRISREKPRQKK